MSQISKKPVSLPLRKRLRPTVNLNVAGRRRNNVKDSPSLPDGEASTEKKTVERAGKVNDSKSDSLDNGNACNDSNSIDHCVEGDHNTSFESRASVISTASTVILQNGTIIPTSNEHEINHSLNKSIDSTASTVLILPKDNAADVSEKVQEDELIQSHDFDDSRSISSNISSIHVSGNGFNIDSNNIGGKIDNSFSNSNEVSTTISNVLKSKNHEKLLEEGQKLDERTKSNNHNTSIISDKNKGDIPANSVSVITSSISHLNCSNADSESVIGDDRSSVYSFTSGSDKLPHKYRRRPSSVAKWLTDAKKEFASRFVDKKPERSSLRMLDLIYYNPTTNPMKTTPDSSQEVIAPSHESEVNRIGEEEIDEPEEQDAEDEENTRVPAPRVKVGPNGEIVLDEQSLVIETTQSKKSRKEIANLTVVVDSGSNTTYHTYSKKKRRRCDWNIHETVRFYKALQSIGTDFSLMQSLFPSRSRLDLKAKFKKEERINGHLIEKALRFPSLFDLSELEKEPISVNDNENDESKKDKRKDKKGKKRSLNALGFDEDDRAPARRARQKLQKKGDGTPSQKGKHVKRRKPQGKKTSDGSSGEEDQTIADDLQTVKDSTEVEAVKSRPKRVPDANRPNYAAMENGHDCLEDDVSLLDCSSYEDNEKEGEEESTQMEVMQGNGIELEETISEPIVESNVPNNAPIPLENFSMNNVQPGSLVLLTTECPGNPGYQICNVFMVQDNATGLNGDAVPQNVDNYYSFPAGEISSSIIDIGGETQPS